MKKLVKKLVVILCMIIAGGCFLTSCANEESNHIDVIDSEMKTVLKQKIETLIQEEFIITSNYRDGKIEVIKVVVGSGEIYDLKLTDYAAQCNLAYGLYIGNHARLLDGYFSLLDAVENAEVYIEDNEIILDIK